MTIQVWSNHGLYNIIAVTHGSKEWFMIEKDVNFSAKISMLTEEKAKQIIEKNKLSVIC